MRKNILSPFITFGAAFSLLLALFAGSAAMSAQATPESEADGAVHPAHIHAGVCPEPGDVVFPLEDVVPLDADTTDTALATPDAMSTPAGDAMTMGTPAGDAMTMDTQTTDTVMGLGSTTEVEVSLDDILADDHSIVMHLSPEQMAVFVVCGDVTGTVENDGLVIDLAELNDSGVSGWAILTDNGDGTTTVIIEARHVALDMQGTPMSTPQP